MTIRFFILQAHYRSTLDFSNEALQAAEKGLKKLLESHNRLLKLFDGHSFEVDPDSAGNWLDVAENASPNIKELVSQCYQSMNDDLNTAILISHLFEAVRIINSESLEKPSLKSEDLLVLKNLFQTFVFEILGLKDEKSNDQGELLDGLMQLVLAIRQKSRETKDWGTSDQIRDALQNLKITVKDGKEGSAWGVEY